MTTFNYQITIDPSIGITTQSVMGSYCQNSTSFLNIARLNCSDGNSDFSLKQNDVLNLYINFNTSNLDTSGATRIQAAYLNSLIGAVYNNPENTSDVSTSSLGMVSNATLGSYFSVNDADGAASPAIGGALVFCKGFTGDNQLGKPLALSSASLATQVGRLSVLTSASANLEMHLMGNLILELYNSSTGNTALYEWLGFNHDPRMVINPR